MGDLESAVLRLDRHLRARVNVLRRESRLSEQVRERHREAARVGRAEKLLRVRSRHTSKPSPKRISGIDLA